MVQAVKEHIPQTSRLLLPMLELRYLSRKYVLRRQTPYFIVRHKYKDPQALKYTDLAFIQHFILVHIDQEVYAKPIEIANYKRIRNKYDAEFKLALQVMRDLKHGENVLPENKAYVEKYYGKAQADLVELFH
jgi:hypothetical protein